MDSAASSVVWAQAEFGDARLGNELRTRRLVAMGARCAQAPAGRVTELVDVSPGTAGHRPRRARRAAGGIPAHQCAFVTNGSRLARPRSRGSR